MENHIPPETRTEPAKAEAEALKMTGTRVISIGITNDISEDFLQSVSSPPQIEGQSYFKVANFRALTAIRKAVGEGTCKKIIGITYLSFNFSILISYILLLFAFYLFNHLKAK